MNLEQAELRRAELFGLIEDRGDGLDVISGEEGQSAADRLPGVERFRGRASAQPGQRRRVSGGVGWPDASRSD